MDLREEFLELLKKDKDFRYTVLGYLGLDEIIRRMDAYESTQTKIWEEIKGLRKDFNEMLDRIKTLEKGHVDLREDFQGLRSELFVGFDNMRMFAGVSLEEFVKVWISGSLRERGILPVGRSLDRAVIDGEEINLFSEEPLIVGEVTAYAGSVEEISKLLRKVEAAKKKYKKEPRYLFLRVVTAPSSVAKEMKRIAKAKNIDLVIGKES